MNIDARAVQQVIRNLQISKVEWRDESSPDLIPYTHSKLIETVVCKPTAGSSNVGIAKGFLNDIIHNLACTLTSAKVIFSHDPGNVNLFILEDAKQRLLDDGGSNNPDRYILEVIDALMILVQAKRDLSEDGLMGMVRGVFGKHYLGNYFHGIRNVFLFSTILIKYY